MCRYNGGEMKKAVLLLVLSVIVGVLYPLQALAYSGMGTGTPSGPYLITDCTQLQEMRDNLDGNYRLANDINCNLMGLAWEPIGFDTNFPFTGTFDGDNYTIFNLGYSGGMYAGLFGNVSDATLKNVSFSSANITSTGMAGVLAGTTLNSTIEHVTVTNSAVTSELNAGGLVGILQSTTLSDSATYNTSVSGRSPATFGSQLGGLIGISTGSTISRVSSSGYVTQNAEAINNSNRFGGLIGSSTSDVISDSYSTVAVSGYSNIGGLIGFASSTSLAQTYASGAIEGDSDIGGLIGYEGLAYIVNSFSQSAATGILNVGGLIGHAVAVGGSPVNSTWDITLSGVADCVGYDQSISFPTTCTGVNPSNSAPGYFINNNTQSPLDTWDFNIVWQTTAGLPILITTPDRADNVHVTRSPTSIIVTWEVPATTGGNPVTSYDLKYRPESSIATTNVTGITPTPGSTQYTIPGLTPNTSYIIEIRAHNARGTGIWAGFITSTLALPVVTTSTPPAAMQASSTLAPDMAVTETPTPIETPTTTPKDSVDAVTASDDVKTEATQGNNPLGLVLIIVGVIVGAGSLVLVLRYFAKK